MGVSKAAKDKVIGLMLQNIPTDKIAAELGYSVGTVRKVYEELREEYGVSTTKEIVSIYLDKELAKLNNHISNVRKLLKKSQNCDYPKRRPIQDKHQNKNKS
jgi:hypothetical protein